MLANNQGLVFKNNIIEGGVVAIAIYSPSPGMSFSQNHILKAPEGWSIWVSPGYSGPEAELDFTNNYWGTTDLAEISAGILDGFDNDDIDMYVLFEPIADGPVSTETMKWGGVKALFR